MTASYVSTTYTKFHYGSGDTSNSAGVTKVKYMGVRVRSYIYLQPTVKKWISTNKYLVNLKRFFCYRFEDYRMSILNLRRKIFIEYVIVQYFYYLMKYNKLYHSSMVSRFFQCLIAALFIWNSFHKFGIAFLVLTAQFPFYFYSDSLKSLKCSNIRSRIQNEI